MSSVTLAVNPGLRSIVTSIFCRFAGLERDVVGAERDAANIGRVGDGDGVRARRASARGRRPADTFPDRASATADRSSTLPVGQRVRRRAA